ncbi:hypothetical protein H9L12_02620 [Sphingomonas rhizophila]|uniref:Transferrin-binding protein B C-lobe/N-lobe beta-barrel domain-containing protein n=1 Tax=Sphingomonas rhizophila TaxID=2071607 RepID=A0A7G9SCD6_9SPHN|nr:hypothetical protein [Sphingomonas rhizophila]QNN65511.1 hypothetical protein H9L12_02620 [Sphingomonas rhizophila]
MTAGAVSKTTYDSASQAYTFAPIQAGPSVMDISYSGATGKYTVSVPDYPAGELERTGTNGNYDASGWTAIYSTTHRILGSAGPGTDGVSVTIDWPDNSTFSYTSFGNWYNLANTSTGSTYISGNFAYGVPSAPGDIPLTGTAHYTGSIRGGGNEAWFTWLTGTVAMDFDFADGTLDGEIDMAFNEYYDTGFDVPLLTFSETLFAQGSQVFSGKFDQAGVSRNTGFQGQFTGPGAAELLSSFSGELNRPGTDEWVPVGGVWIAKKQ